MEKLYIVSRTRLGADCGSDYELLIGKFRLKLKKVGKTTKPFRYDLNQIPYDCTVEVTNRFKGLALIDRMPEELWMEVCNIVQEVVIKTIPKRKGSDITTLYRKCHFVNPNLCDDLVKNLPVMQKTWA